MNQSRAITAVILAAGKGTRMGSDLHKVLHKLNGKPLLGHVFDNLKALQAKSVKVVVGAGRDQITDAFPNIDTVIQEEQLGTGHAVMSAMKSLTNTDGIILVLYGDVPLVSAETMRNLCEKIGDNYALAVLGFSPRDTRAYGRLITNQNGELEQIVEHAEASDAQRAVGFCNSGILAGRAEDMRRLMPKIRNDNSKGEYYLTDIVALARAEGLQVATSEADEMEVTGVNSKPELLALELLYLDTLKKRA